MKKTCNTRQHQINRIILIINVFKRQLYCYSRNNLIKHYLECTKILKYSTI